MKKILLAGPGTGKTTKVKREFLGAVDNISDVLVLSFTNATINDLRGSFERDRIGITEANCLTLHAYALRLNHRENTKVLSGREEKMLKQLARLLEVDFRQFCEMLDCITYKQMIVDIISFAETNPVYFNEKVGDIELLIIDEYQDFNEEEQELINLISEHARATIILGDDDQCIYDFKDANTTEIVRLYNDPEVENIEHDNVCHRCPDAVIDACSSLLSRNKERVDKEWNKSGIVGQVSTHQFATLGETDQWLIEQISRIKTESPASSILVLSPIKDAVSSLLVALDESGIPYVDFFGDSFDLNLFRKLWELKMIYTRHKLLHAILLVLSSDITQYRRRQFREMLLAQLTEEFTFGNVRPRLDRFLDSELLKLVDTPPAFEELIQQHEYAELSTILSDIEGDEPEAKLSKVDKFIAPPTMFDQEAVNVMTIHKSKGLEADYVFIVGLVDGILPRISDGIGTVEAQRRLLFVGMSRAQNELHLISTVKWDGKHVHRLEASKFTRTHPKSRTYNGQTSPFINELGL